MLHTKITPPVTEGAPRVYSYTRFSTPEQAQGDSRRRQAEAAAAWAKREGLILDERLSLHDLGVSAYRGSNTIGDAGLAGFLEACRQGLIPEGSFLLVESLDRISRMAPRKVQRLVNDIVDAGVTICTLNDGQRYDSVRLDEDPMALFIAMMVSWRAHEESKTKGRRVAAAWAEKRRKVRAGESQRLTTIAPAWLRWTIDGWTFEAPHHETVRRIYALTLGGMGEHKIAQTLNLEGVPTMGRAKFWHRSTVCKVLRNPATIGTLTPARIDYGSGKRERVFEDPIPNAYPAVISEEDWLAVQAIKRGSGPAVRGRAANAALSNIFAGLAKCPECGAAMTRVQKGSRSKPSYVCTRAKVGAADHPYRSIKQEIVERAFLWNWQSLLIDVPAGDAGGTLDDEHSSLQGVIWEEEERLENLMRLLDREPSRTLASRVRSAEVQLAALRSDLAALEEHRMQSDHGLVHARIEALADTLGGPEEELEGPLDVARVNAALRVLFSQVTIDYLTGKLRFQWRQGGEGAVMFAWPS